MTIPRAPRWAHTAESERVEHRASRLAALHLLAGELGDIPKTEIAAALGVSRWTLDRDLASLPDVAAHVARLAALLKDAAALP